MDLSAILAIAGQLLALYEKASAALSTPGVGKEELDLLHSLAVAIAELTKTDASDTNERDAIAAHKALVAAAFARAYSEHWASNKDLLLQQNDRARAAMRAIASIPTPEGEMAQLQLINRLTDSALTSPAYLTLWRSFTGASPPLLLVTGGAEKLRFEESFQLAFSSLMAGPAGVKVQQSLERCGEHRGRAIRRLIALDTQSWFSRHVFGNARHHPELDPMPLISMYVEPKCAPIPREPGQRVPVQQWIHQSLSEPSLDVLVVQADFGRGKSLTARWLAAKCAREFLQGEAPSSDCWYPIYIRAADDLASSENTVTRIVRRALQRQANEPSGLNLCLEYDDSALDLPTGRTLIIIDGLDEVSLSIDEQMRLFQQLKEKSSRDRRFVVLGRPESLRMVLSSKISGKLGLSSARLVDFEPEAAQDWLTRWIRHSPSRSPVTWATIESNRLEALAMTPVLLFMIAYTLSAPAPDASQSRSFSNPAELYEAFCRTLARGKLALSGEEHEPIVRASGTLLSALQARNLLPHSGDEPIEAMLWLMSRVAWEGARKAPSALVNRHIENILDEELGLTEADLDHVLLGSLLAMQTDLSAGKDRIFFGHRSFFEYLVARWWHINVKRIALLHDRTAQRQAEKASLSGASFLDGIKPFVFFEEMLNRDSPSETKRIAEWSVSRFRDFCSSDDDRDTEIAAAALGFACILHEDLDLTNEVCQKGLRKIGASDRALTSVHHTILRDADLRAQNLVGCCFDYADLRGANLSDAIVERCSFTGSGMLAANLSASFAEGARFDSALLKDSNITAAHLRRCDFRQADLRDVNFSGSDLSGSDFREANLTGANLFGCKLEGCNMSGAVLERAVLKQANLQGCDLSNCNLVDADLEGADFQRTLLASSRASGPTS